jgi:hypothetical protein
MQAKRGIPYIVSNIKITLTKVSFPLKTPDMYYVFKQFNANEAISGKPGRNNQVPYPGFNPKYDTCSMNDFHPDITH